MDADNLSRWGRRLLRERLHKRDKETALSLGPIQLEKLLPHRGPALLVDRVEAVDRQGQTLRAVRTLVATDRGFEGHFPGEPVYPGVLQIEAMGQAALCLFHLVRSGFAFVPDAKPDAIRLTRVMQATFVSALRPGDTVSLEAHVVELDDMLSTAATQLYRGDELCAAALLEVYRADS